VHPGFFGRIGRKSQRAPAGEQQQARRGGTGRSPVPLASVSPAKVGTDGSLDAPPEHVYGLPPGLAKHDHDHDDTSYKGAAGSDAPHIRFISSETHHPDAWERASSRGSSLAPPQPPPHARPAAAAGGRRTFSFQNPFHRRSHHDAEDADRPTSRGAQSFTSRTSAAAREYPTGNLTTDEERAGLVSGDRSNATLPRYTEVPEEEEGSRRSSDEWQVTSGTSGSSPEMVGSGGDLGRQRRRERGAYEEVDEDDEEGRGARLRSPLTRDEVGGGGRGGGGGAFV
ncbi:hypothetical protein LTR53_018113, partial [Teratosphaeriaceae sp. CCFEE 6253]